MRRAWLAVLLPILVPRAEAADLTAAERERARSLPHFATAAARMQNGRLLHGNLVILAYDHGHVRVEFAGLDADGATSVQAEFGLADAQVTDRGALRAQFRAPEGPEGRYANHGTLVADGLVRGASLVRSDLRVDPDGLFALELEGVEDGRSVPVMVFGRALGTCWATRKSTLKRVVDLTKRPDCQRLFGGL